jgi:outer membrane protein OmpA-like peptidoglycan-associated protein
MNMMKRINFQLLKITTGIVALLLLCTTYAAAQDAASASNARPKDMLEIGVHGGSLFVSGEIDPEIRYGYGFHIRKAVDYMFSLRFDAMLGSANGTGRDGEDFWTHETKWSSATILGLFSLNSVRLDSRRKKTDLYVLAGGGGNYYEVAARTPGTGAPRFINLDRELAAHVTLGAGLAFRVSNKFNIGIEHQASSAFGRRSDLLDGIDFEANDIRERSGFSDILNYTSLRLNFNIGNAASKSEPLYWGNLSDGLASSIDDVRKRQESALADTDLDGVIDAIDQEPNTPANVPVDTKGRTLDSDKDGIADYKDLEPYYPPRAGEQVNEDGVVVNPIGGPNGGGVTEERVKEMIDEALSQYGLSEPKGNVAEWFLPMIHFGSDSYRIKYADYGTLASIARMLKSTPSMRLVITGFTDQTGPESYNEGLSYQRAAAIAEHLVNQHGIGRGRMILQWKGQDEALVPSGASYMNRRVEFRVAGENDYEMDPPAGLKKKSSTDGY